MNYSDPFGIQQSSPLSRTLRFIELQGNMALNWPEGYFGADYVASINDVNPVLPNLVVTLPDASQANEGTGMLFTNVGEYAFSLRNHDEAVLTTFSPGQSKYIYCSNNQTSAGEWRVTGFGVTTHAADAVALAGPGTRAIGGQLAVAYPVAISTSNHTITSADRGKIFAAGAGSVSIQLPAYTIGNDFFVTIKNGGSGTVSVTAPSATIDGFPSIQMAPNESAMFCCSGTAAWYTIGYGRSTEFQFTKLVKDVTIGGTITLTSAEASNKLMQFIGAPGSNVIIVVPSVVGIYYIQNSFSGPNSLTIRTASGSGIALSSSDRAILYCDGVNVTSAQSVAVGTNISIVDGSQVSPSINFAADTNTGLYRADVDTLGIVSNGVDAARFHSNKVFLNGQVGIGVANPSGKLHINAGTGVEAIRLQGGGSTIQFWSSDNVFRHAYMSAEVANVDGSSIGGLRDYVEGSGERVFYIGGVRKVVISPTGATVNGTFRTEGNARITGNLQIDGNLVNAAGQSFYASLTNNTFNGVQQIQSERFKFISLGSLSAGTTNLDLASAGTFSCTVLGVVNFTFSNKPPAGYDQTTYLKIINGSAFPPNWPAGTKYPKGVKPVLSAGMDLLAIWYDPELQAHVVGKVWEDFK